jgi:SOS response regulatory protein OraA/RecX
MDDKIYGYAIKLLAGRDYSVQRMRARLEKRFGRDPAEVIDRLLSAKFLDDRRFAESFVRVRKNHGRPRLRVELIGNGIAETIADDVLERENWPSLVDALGAKMRGLKLHPPVSLRDAARLSRFLLRLGYDEEEIREELERLI